METEKELNSKIMEIIPFPTGRIPRRLIEVEGQRSYEEVAQSLGFAPAELVRAQLLAFFEEAGIKLYDYDQVSAWLTKKKVEAKATHWCWRALRNKDIITNYYWGYDREHNRWNDGFYSSKNDACCLYDRLVPLHALKKVAKIEARLGDHVRFFVSDYATPNPDPFIMVRPTKSDPGTVCEYQFIFDAWDEPGFGV